MKISLNNFGKKLKLKESKKSVENKEDKFFIEMITLFEACWDKSNKLNQEFFIDLIKYEEGYFQLIENFIIDKYVGWKVDLILWYIYGRKNLETNEITPLVLDDEGKLSNKTVSNPKELLDLIKYLENK